MNTEENKKQKIEIGDHGQWKIKNGEYFDEWTHDYISTHNEALSVEQKLEMLRKIVNNL